MTPEELASFDAMAPKAAPPGTGPVTQDDLNNFDNMAAEHHQSLLGRIGGALSSAKDTALNFVNPMLSSATGGLAPIISTPMQMAITGNPNPMSAYRQLAEQAQPKGKVGMAGSLVGGMLPAALAPETMAASGLSRIIPAAGDSISAIMAKNAGTGALQGLNASPDHPILGSATGASIGAAIPAMTHAAGDVFGAIGSDVAPWLQRMRDKMAASSLGVRKGQILSTGATQPSKNPFGGDEDSPGVVNEIGRRSLEAGIISPDVDHTVDNALAAKEKTGAALGENYNQLDKKSPGIDLSKFIQDMKAKYLIPAQNLGPGIMNRPVNQNVKDDIEALQGKIFDKVNRRVPVEDNGKITGFENQEINVPKLISFNDISKIASQLQKDMYTHGTTGSQNIKQDFEKSADFVKDLRAKIFDEAQNQADPGLANDLKQNNRDYFIFSKAAQWAKDRQAAEAARRPDLMKYVTGTELANRYGPYAMMHGLDKGSGIANYLKNGMNLTPNVPNSLPNSAVPSILNYLNQGNQNAP